MSAEEMRERLIPLFEGLRGAMVTVEATGDPTIAFTEFMTVFSDDLNEAHTRGPDAVLRTYEGIFGVLGSAVFNLVGLAAALDGVPPDQLLEQVLITLKENRDA
ncbi:MAG: hypothetical protein PGN07_06295 [Aeromicrobium erythreum]